MGLNLKNKNTSGLKLYNYIKLTLRYSKEYKLARHGNITSGKLHATDITKPILMISLAIDCEKFSIILPEKVCPLKATYPKKPTKIYTPVQIPVADFTISFIFCNEGFGRESYTSKTLLKLFNVQYIRATSFVKKKGEHSITFDMTVPWKILADTVVCPMAATAKRYRTSRRTQYVAQILQ